MNATKQFLRAHLNAEREVLLLPPAPVRVEVEWSAQRVIDAMISTFQQALELFEQLEEFKPVGDEAMATIGARITCLVELESWGVPEGLSQWIATRLPVTVAKRLAEVIDQ